MALDETRRKQLDAIVVKMAAAGATPEEARLIVEDFKGKFGADAKFSMSSVAMGPGAIPKDVDVSDAAPTVAGLYGSAALGAAGAAAAGAGTVGKIVSAATSPTGIGVGTTAAELYHGEDLGQAVKHGLIAGVGAKLLGGGKVADIAAGRSLSLKARLAHALGQAVKAEPEVAKKLAPLVEDAAPVLKAVAKRITVKEATKKLTQAGARAGANALEKRILDEYMQGQSDGQITDTLRQTHGIPDSFGAQMVKAVRETYGLVTHAMGAK